MSLQIFRNKLQFFAAAKVSSSFPAPNIPEIAFAGRHLRYFSFFPSRFVRFILCFAAFWLPFALYLDGFKSFHFLGITC